MKKILKFSFLLFLVFFLLLSFVSLSSPSKAARGTVPVAQPQGIPEYCKSIFSTLKVIYKCSPEFKGKEVTISIGGEEKEIACPENLFDIVECLIWAGILFLLNSAWIVAVIMIIISGYKYMASAGYEEAQLAAKKTLIAAIVGFIIALLAIVIVNFTVTFVELKENGIEKAIEQIEQIRR